MTMEDSNAAINEQYREYVMPVWKQLQVPVKRAAGCTLEDFDGNTYLDAFSGISVTNAGHGNQAVADAVTTQVAELVHACSYVHPTEPVAALAERLATLTPGRLQKTFFCNSGTEAVEGSVKLARKYTGNKEVVALEMAFHGRTLGSLALTGNQSYKRGMAPTLNDVAHTAAPYAYRCQRCDAECDASCADALERTIETATAGDLAAVIVEPILGEGGIIVPPDGWLSRVQEITHDHGGLLIVDEVQTGYGRTGSFWAVDHTDAEPDILAQAKGIANGLPLGAFTARPDIADAFEGGDHFSTFGGNPVACAAALATIDELDGGLIENANEQGAWLEPRVAELEADHPAVGDVRGRGLMWGLELVDPTQPTTGVAPPPDAQRAKAVATHLRENGVIVGVGGFHGNVVRMQPPLTIDREQLKTVLVALELALTETETHGSADRQSPPATK